MVIPRDPEGSNLISLLPEVRMPHGKKKVSICVQSGRRPALPSRSREWNLLTGLRSTAI